jgi:hypothetical protein
VYSSIPSGNAVTVTIALANGASRTATLSGERHASRAITRTKTTAVSGTTISRTDNVTIDGDLSAVPVGLTSGPTMNDKASNPHLFTKWTHTLSTPTATHTLVWDRFATWTANWTYTSGVTPGWSAAISSMNENIYIQRDGGAVLGPMDDVDLRNRFRILHDLNGAAQHF